MKGVGVGDTAATPFAAAITWILKDGTGMAGRIIFAWIEGTRLDGDCKKWRLFADALNDSAMALELLLPMFMEYSTYILCISTGMKSVVGVAGGATRAAITQHQAIRNNMADVSAKDGSQETFVNLCASIVGIIILATFDEGEFVWQLFTFFTIIHLFANYKAVRSLKMVTLNNERLNLLLLTFLSAETVSSPEIVNNHESVIVGTGLSDKDLCGFKIILGASLQNAVEGAKLSSEDIKLLINFYRSKRYLLIMDVRGRKIYACLPQGEKTVDVVQSYFHAVTLGIATCISSGRDLVVINKVKSRPSTKTCPLSRLQTAVIRITGTKQGGSMRIPIEAMIAADEVVSKEFPAFMEATGKQGWSIDSHHITVDEWRGVWSNFSKIETSEDGETPDEK
ncbi:RUS family member 1 isoform X2 [Periplaneta americana]